MWGPSGHNSNSLRCPLHPFHTLQGNYMMRGVSGGERKRVSIGHELLINPSIIMLDEVGVQCAGTEGDAGCMGKEVFEGGGARTAENG